MAKIILTGDRTLIGNYDVLLEAILGSVSTTKIPNFLYERFISPMAELNDNYEIRNPPYGLRKLESALLSNGFERSEITFARPEALSIFEKECKIIGITSGDPLGMGMTSTTIHGIFGGEPYTKLYFQDVITYAKRIKKNRDIKICCGGPGMWQFIKNKEQIKKMGIDHVFLGYGEKTVPKAFKDIIEKKNSLPEIIICEEPKISEINQIIGPSSMGIVEIGRGCGRGCKFCILRNTPMVHIPKEFVLSEIQTNLIYGIRNIATLSEDFLRYGSDGIGVDEKKVIDLYESISKLPGLRLIQLDHVNVSSVGCVSDLILRRIHDAVALHRDNQWIWLNAGIETASPRLLKEIAPAKAKPFDIDEWPTLIRQTIGRLNDSGFMPFVSIILGLPQEIEDDVLKTHEFLDDIKMMRTAVFPVFYVGVADNDPSFQVNNMKPYHWELFRDAYEMNFKWVPKLVSMNQKEGGVGLKKRLITQMVGHLWIWTSRLKIRRL